MHIPYLPDYWQIRLKQYALGISKGKFNTLGATAFPNQTLIVKFEDGSICSFNNAFYLEDRDKNEICILTEHCGYFIVFTNGIIIEIKPIQ
jgi:hypothetical protein